MNKYNKYIINRESIIYINKNYKMLDDPLIYKLYIVFHELNNKIILYKNQRYKVLKVYKIWNWGWYYTAEILNMINNNQIEIPIKNKSCELPEIVEYINRYSKDVVL